MRLALVLFALLLASPALAQEAATDFTLPSLDGANVSLSDHLGKKVIVVNFWATWCAPCLKEMAKLDELQKAMPDAVQVISISTDDPRDQAKVKATIHRMKYTPLVLLDAETRVVGLYNPNKDLPWAMVIGKDKVIHHKKKGFTEGDEVHLRQQVEALAAAK